MDSKHQIIEIPLSKLIASDNNVRKTGGQTIEDLATSILAHGLLHNLVVAKATKGDKYEVIAGSRRFRALTKLAKDKAIPKTFAVPCRVIDWQAGTETSLAENIIRENMHPADQFDAFRHLINEGSGIEEVAARFGVTTTAVRQRLKLANVAPRFIELYRADEVTLDQLMALAITDDHAAQERAWDSAGQWQRQPGPLRRALTATAVDAATDPRVRFIGIETYANAGGHVDRDLFQPEHEGYLTDAALLDKLTAGKLETVANEVRTEGWKWVEIIPNADYSDIAKYGKVYPEGKVEPALEAEIKALEAEADKIEEDHQSQEYPDNVEARLSEIEERIDVLHTQTRQFTPEQKALAGAVVSIGNIERGLVRPEDKRKVNAALPEANGETQTGDNQAHETGLSTALVEDLTAQRTAALRTMLATRPEVALVAVTHALVLRLCYPMETSYDVGSALSLASEKGGCSLNHHAANIQTSRAHNRLHEIQNAWTKRIPKDPSKLWDWLLQQEDAVVIDLLAFCVGQTVHVVRLAHESGSAPRFAAADKLGRAVDLNMADWWTPTAESYLGRVKKEQILEAITEATGETDIDELRKLKKTELVTKAEERLVGARWLPKILK